MNDSSTICLYRFVILHLYPEKIPHFRLGLEYYNSLLARMLMQYKIFVARDIPDQGIKMLKKDKRINWIDMDSVKNAAEVVIAAWREGSSERKP